MVNVQKETSYDCVDSFIVGRDIFGSTELEFFFSLINLTSKLTIDDLLINNSRFYLEESLVLGF